MLKQWFLPGTLFFLSLISILILRSVAPQLLEKQLFFFIVGVGIFWFTSRISFSRWQSIGWPLYAGLILSLIVTQAIATVTRGTKSWIEIGPFHAQPSQLAVAISGLLLGNLISDPQPLTLRRYLVQAAVLLLPAVLIFLEPDLGTVVIYVLACGTAFLVGKVPWTYLLSTAAIGIVGVVVAWIFILKPYQKLRVTSFLHSEGETQSASYNAVQSVIAVGSGGLTGKGLGQGTQSQLRFLPERQTDFVFASFAEESGFIGGGMVIGLYAFLVGTCFWIAQQEIHPEAQLFAVVTGVMFLIQVVVNIGMNIGLLPITGVTLPFISYGGSSILALAFQLGCLQAILRDLEPSAKLTIR